MTDQSALPSLLIIPLKAFFSLVWLILLIAGAAPIQQMRQLNKVLTTPLGGAFWFLYFGYVIIAVIFFLTGMAHLWLFS